MKMKTALIIVDLQNDFCPGGALPVPEGDRIVPVLNRVMHLFPFIVTTQDWHPLNHCSFKSQGGPWPPHCIQRTPGAELHPGLDTRSVGLSILKGTLPEQDAYSGFGGTSLADNLKNYGIQSVYLAGLATDYCVKNTALDALKYGFETYLLTDLMRGIEAQKGDIEKALQTVQNAGARIMESMDLDPSHLG